MREWRRGLDTPRVREGPDLPDRGDDGRPSALSACGGSESGPPKLTFFVAIQPGGTIEETAARCTKESHGRYEVKPEFLPNDASQAREQLVRRLGAKDPSIDIIGLDVILTSEFANAGWIEPWQGKRKEQATKTSSPACSKPRPSRRSCTRRRSTPTPSCSGTAKTWSKSRRRPGTR